MLKGRRLLSVCTFYAVILLLYRAKRLDSFFAKFAIRTNNKPNVPFRIRHRKLVGESCDSGRGHRTLCGFRFFSKNRSPHQGSASRLGRTKILPTGGTISREATAAVLAASGVCPADIKAIGISYQMHGLVAVDKDMNVLRDAAIIWCDSRGVPYGRDALRQARRRYLPAAPSELSRQFHCCQTGVGERKRARNCLKNTQGDAARRLYRPASDGHPVHQSRRTFGIHAMGFCLKTLPHDSLDGLFRLRHIDTS